MNLYPVKFFGKDSAADLTGASNSMNSSNPTNPSNSMNSSNPTNPSNQSILLTIDVEDWFQVENFKKYIPLSSWSSYELRVEQNTHHILNLLDSQELVNPTNTSNPMNTTNPKNSPKATFFVLGWIADRIPDLVREIYSRGHEVASHGYGHKLSRDFSSEDLRKDLTKSKKRLEDIIGAPVYGYRAPSFTISDDILKTIQECGYRYDSSFNSFGVHSRYGQVDLSKKTRNGIAVNISDTFYELPISNIRFVNRTLPWGGGGYFRFMPFALFKLGVQSILKKEKAYLFYMHPWEVDPNQPRVHQASRVSRLRHYTNLNKTEAKLSSFLEAFKECNFITCYQYLINSSLPLAYGSGS